MSCTPCTELKSISLCTDSLVIGQAPLANTPYVVYFRSLATGAIYSYKITSDASKILTLQFTDGFALATQTGYEMWINQAGDSIEKQLNLTIGTVTAVCFNLSANGVFDIYYSINTNFTSQTLELA